MAFAQKNYLELQGKVSPSGVKPKYRISQIGCYLTAYCNLLERFGKTKNPLELNAIFRDMNIWTDVDDKIYDDLTNTSITKYDPNIVLTGSGTSGLPPHNDAIVKFRYKGSAGFNTHFSKVHHIEGNQVWVIDSYDGVVRNGTAKYGNPLRWDTYEDRTPAPTPPPVVQPAPVPTPPAPAPTPQSDIIPVKAQSGWGISHLLKAAGYNKQQWDNPAEWQRVSELNGAPQGLRIKVGQSYKVHRTPLVIAPTPTPVPVPAPPPVVAPTPPTPAPEIPAEDPLKLAVDKNEYKNTATAIDLAFLSLETITVHDMDGLHIDKQLPKGRRVDAGQLFTKDGIEYVRTKKSVEDGIWYGIPKDKLDAGQNPNKYVGPLTDDEDDSPFSLNAAKEARELLGKLSFKDKINAFFATIQGYFMRKFAKKKINKEK